ncbi:hypothetical protein [Nocardioides ferulae]|uniref:hypothetical protein n=1 Tax=Nocardioides ferulae TaxID=2340821 RepID=UPI000EAC8E4B|nr:hypothetical protein [Nocardioides ferulae]
MQPDSEDEAWRAIVENYGERPDLDPDDPPPAATAPDPVEPAEDHRLDDDPWPEERFVPPPPPPLPHPSRDRMAAWVGVFGSPTVLLVCLVLGIELPTLIAFGLVVAFVGGFLYLVLRMPRGPRDPWDDGAQV